MDSGSDSDGEQPTFHDHHNASHRPSIVQEAPPPQAQAQAQPVALTAATATPLQQTSQQQQQLQQTPAEAHTQTQEAQTSEADAVAAAMAAAPLDDEDENEGPVVRLHGNPTDLVANSALFADSSSAPIMPAAAAAVAAQAAPASTASSASASSSDASTFGRSDEATLGPAPGPSIPAAAAAQPAASVAAVAATAPVAAAATVATIATVAAVEAVAQTQKDAAVSSSSAGVAPAATSNGVARPGAPASSSHGHASFPSAAAAAVPSSTSNPHAGAVAAALWPLLQQVQPSPSAPSTASAAIPPLEQVLGAIQSLPYDVRCTFFTQATTPSSASPSHPPASRSEALGPSSAIFHAVLNYFLEDSLSGSGQDVLCKFLYESYWEASTKLGHSKNNVSGAPASPPSAASAAVPPAHMFLLNFLPFLVWKFIWKHYSIGATSSSPAATSSSFPSSSSSSSTSTSSYAGLFTVFLALYNTERILSVRAGPSGGILARPTVPNLPALQGLTPFDFKSTGGGVGGSRSSSATSAAGGFLPAISEPTTPHVTLLLHILLLKHSTVLAALIPESREALVYLSGLATNSGLLGTGGDLFVESLRASRKAMFGQHASALGPLQLQAQAHPVRWNTRWSATSNAVTVRYVLTADMLQDFLVCLTYVLTQARHTPASLSQHGGPARDWREFVMVALRQVHCRALEEMIPEVLLQTTCLLQQEEDLQRALEPPANRG